MVRSSPSACRTANGQNGAGVRVALQFRPTPSVWTPTRFLLNISLLLVSSASDGRSRGGSKPPDYRLPESSRLGRVRLQVADLTRSLAFYEDILGLSVLGRPDGRAILGVQDPPRPLVEVVERPGARRPCPRDRLGLFHVALRLPNRVALGRFVRHLDTADVRPGTSDHRVSEAVYLPDPDGLGIEVYADRPSSEWERDDDGQIVMTTEPLDTRSLLETAGTTSWTGAPPSTTVGHVHLHVGDLRQAAAFYHEALGLDKTMWSYPGALFLSAGGYHHHLGTNVWAEGAPPPSEDEVQLLEWTLVVPEDSDVAAAASSVEAGGYSVTSDGGDFLTMDPWDTRLRVTSAE